MPSPAWPRASARVSPATAALVVSHWGCCPRPPRRGGRRRSRCSRPQSRTSPGWPPCAGGIALEVDAEDRVPALLAGIDNRLIETHAHAVGRHVEPAELGAGAPDEAHCLGFPLRARLEASQRVVPTAARRAAVRRVVAVASIEGCGQFRESRETARARSTRNEKAAGRPPFRMPTRQLRSVVAAMVIVTLAEADLLRCACGSSGVRGWA